jgi:hypothetical protein
MELVREECVIDGGSKGGIGRVNRRGVASRYEDGPGWRERSVWGRAKDLKLSCLLHDFVLSNTLCESSHNYLANEHGTLMILHR